MNQIIECPRCNSDNVDQFINDDHLWHCNTCSEMWEMSDDVEFVYTNLTVYPEPMDGVSYG